MALKVPTLKRIDEPKYIQFRLEPAPRLRKTETTLIKVSDYIARQYHACFESDYLNEIQSIVFE
jgi:hypothetical protein